MWKIQTSPNGYYSQQTWVAGSAAPNVSPNPYYAGGVRPFRQWIDGNVAAHVCNPRANHVQLFDPMNPVRPSSILPLPFCGGASCSASV